MGRYLLGVDIGTYESKGTLTTVEGQVVAVRVRPHNLVIPKQGWAEHDAETVWWGDFCLIVRGLLQESGINPNDILAVGCSAIGPDVVPIDQNGRALRPAILYGIDTRATAEIDALEKQFGRENIFKQCGNYLSAQSAGPKILWLKKHEPEIYQRAYKIVTGATFLVGRLTGRYLIDYYTAAAGFTPLYATATGDWFEALCQSVIDLEKLPELAWSADIAGTVTTEAAAQTGLIAGTPVTVGTCDAAAEAVSVGVVSPGQLMLMYGSTAFLIAVIDRPLIDERLWAAPYLFPNTHCLTAGMSTTGSLTRWFRDNVAPDLVEVEKKTGDNAYAVLAEQAARVTPGSDGLLVLPYFSGERTPINDPRARGVIFGLTLSHTRTQIYRAILEGIGHGIKHHLDILQEISVSPESIVAVGGGTKNPLWLQIVSDICGQAQQIPAVTFGASYGDAFLAGLGIGVFSTYQDIGGWVKNSHEIQPNPVSTAKYQKYHELYLQLYHQTEKIMHTLGTLV
jgi:xylulokinase